MAKNGTTVNLLFRYFDIATRKFELTETLHQVSRLSKHFNQNLTRLNNLDDRAIEIRIASRFNQDNGLRPP
jgi:hypothetical protein